jgi:dihydroorotate dehydrogenase electron transfer subunit
LRGDEDRVLAPLGRRTIRVSASEQHGAYVVIRCHDRQGPRPQAGQFYMLSTATGWGGGESERPFLPRAFSVLRAPADNDELHFLIEDVGPASKRLYALDRGERLLVVGPLGTSFTVPRGGRRPLLVGGGVGIAPLAILQDQLAQPAPALLGFRDKARSRGARMLQMTNIATDDGSVGHHGPVTELLASALDEHSDTEVYACGPPAMLEVTRVICTARGTPAQLALESGMACGFGACFGCVVPTTVGYLRLCVDGPVLDSQVLSGVGH